MEIIGYSNSNNYFPSPLIIFAIENGAHHAIFPSGKTIIIDNYEDIKSEIPHFIKEKKKIIIHAGQYAYGINNDDIIIGRPFYLYRQLEKLLKSKNLDKKPFELVSEFLKNTSKDREITWLDFIESVRNCTRVRVLITERRVHREINGERQLAKRIIVQLKKNFNFKSCLRKNLLPGEKYTELSMKYNFLLPEFNSNLPYKLI
jgi:hypothetical protein